MNYKEKTQLKLYAFSNNEFVLQAIIDDYQECSFEDNIFQAGQFSVTINFNIPNSQLFERGLFIQFGNSWKFGEITKIQDQIGEDGKGSQFRIITGFDARYILKRRVIKNMNSNGLWVMTGKGELVLRNLINDQCGNNAEAKRKLPIINTIPSSENAIGKEYSASEQFSNLYEICKTIATQSEIGWRLEFDGSNLTLVCFNGTDRSQTVQFSTSFDSLAEGKFVDSSESFANAIYVGGKGQNDDRDIYEGESAISGNSPSGLDRFESWDNQSSMTTENEYEAEALAMLNQYGQTLTMSGNGLAKCPYEYEKEYFTGDKITVAFSGKKAVVQILSVTEHWAFGEYEINFSFGKPQPDLNAQLQLILKQIQKASNKGSSTDSVRWYTIPTDTTMPPADVTYDTIGFVGDIGNGATFTLYLDNQKTGAKSYHVWFKQLSGSGKLTLTTGKQGATNLSFAGGTYVAIISVDENGNIVNVASTPTNTIATGNNQPATSSGVAQAIDDVENSLSPVDVVQSGNMKAVTSNAVFNGFLDKTKLKYGTFGLLGGCENASSTTVDNLLNFELYQKGGMCCGSIYIDTSTLNVPIGWYQFLWLPNRNGKDGDGGFYSKLFLFPFWNNADFYYVINRYYDENLGTTVNQPARIYSSIVDDNFYINDIRTPTSNLMYRKFNPTYYNALDYITNRISGNWRQAYLVKSGNIITLSLGLHNADINMSPGTYDVCHIGDLIDFKPCVPILIPAIFEAGTGYHCMCAINTDGSIYLWQWGYSNPVPAAKAFNITATYVCQ